MAAEALPSWRMFQGPSRQLCFSNIHMSHLVCKERAVDFTCYCSAFILISEFMFINLPTFNIIISSFKYSNQVAAARTLSTLTHGRTHRCAQSRVANSK